MFSLLVLIIVFMFYRVLNMLLYVFGQVQFSPFDIAHVYCNECNVISNVRIPLVCCILISFKYWFPLSS